MPLCALAASIAQAALAQAARWSADARLSPRGGLWLFAAECTDLGIGRPRPLGSAMQFLIAATISLSLAFGLNERSFAAGPAGDHPASAICGWIGVGVKPMTAVFAESLGMDARYGAIFDSPEAGSPAANVGIEMADVLTTVNGNPLEKWSDFAGIIASLAPGDTVYLRIRRNEQLLELALMVGQGKCP